ncbi:hypothetical protein J7J18_06630 [bacterium]|nr:hypothetical protein [bacterium]
MKTNGFGRLDFIVRQKGREILRIVHFDSLGLWFKQDGAGNVMPITAEQALRLINVWKEHHKDVKASISGGLIPYLQTQEITNIEKRMQELKNERSVAISGLVFGGR